MRQCGSYIAIGLISVTISAGMLAVNLSFEAAGSVPDFENCGFLAGSLLALAVIYPILSAFVVSRATRLFAPRMLQSDSERLRSGVICAAAGSGLYFAAGIAITALRSGLSEAPFKVWLLSAGYIALSTIGGLIGAKSGLSAIRRSAWRQVSRANG